MKNFFEKFNSLADFSRTINSRELNKVFSPDRCMSLNASKFDTTTESYNDADNLLQSGDCENLHKIERATISQRIDGGNTQRGKLCRAVAGAFPNIPLYLAGVPNNMLSIHRAPVKTKVLNIVLNLAVSVNVSAEQFVTVGAKIVGIITEIERKGFRVNLYGAIQSMKNGQTVGTIICLKKSASPLNQLNIAYPLINPSMLRRHYFRFVETIPQPIGKDFPKTYGAVVPIKQDSEIIKKLLPNTKPAILNYQEMLSADTQELTKSLLN